MQTNDGGSEGGGHEMRGDLIEEKEGCRGWGCRGRAGEEREGGDVERWR